MEGRKIIIRKKFRFSRYELVQIFAFCVVATHSWTLINMFQDVASWSLSLSIWDLIGTVSYTLIALLFETSVFFLLLMGLGILLPRKLIRDQYVTISGIIVVEATFLSMVLKPYLEMGFDAYTLRLFSFLITMLVLLALIILLIQIPIIIVGISRIEKIVSRIADSLITLAFVYIFVDLVGLLIVIIRNV